METKKEPVVFPFENTGFNIAHTKALPDVAAFIAEHKEGTGLSEDKLTEAYKAITSPGEEPKKKKK